MIRVENLCSGCDIHEMPCMGSACPYYEMVFYECDDCESQEDLYYFDGYELCLKCILKRLDIVKEEDCTCGECGCTEELYEFNGEKICAGCIEKRLDKVKE